MWKRLNDCLDDVNNNPTDYHSDEAGWITIPLQTILSREEYDLLTAAKTKVKQLVNIEFTGQRYTHRTIHFKADATLSIPEHLYQTML